jgi:hypothetical protein
MLSAQDSPVGVPRELLEAKKLELQKEQVRGLRVSAIVYIANGAPRCPKPRPSSAVAKVRSKTT